ncbi:MFS transporter [Streptosporangium saharense]|uniref:MFS transporter n=1 Tax=Streptosporangium saharense TaxID=1706840 RepID=UPI003694449A
MLLALSLPRLAGPLAGALADTLDAEQAVTFLLAAALPFGLATHLPLVAVATALNTIFLPAGRSSIPRMVRPEDLPRAFAAMAVCFNVGYAAGPLVGGVLVALVDPRVALGLNVSTFAVSILLIMRLNPPPGDHGRRGRRGARRRARHRPSPAAAFTEKAQKK